MVISNWPYNMPPAQPSIQQWMNGNAGAPPPTHPGYLVFAVGKGMPTVKHSNYDAAQAEATRLAGLNPNQEYFVMAPAVGIKTKEPVFNYRTMFEGN